MYKTAMLAFLLLMTSPAWSQALLNPSAEETKVSSSSPDLAVIDGCVQYDERQYWLLDNNGTRRRLGGSTKQLKQEVGHEVELIGKPSSRTLGDTPAGGASSVMMVYVFEVKTVKRVADTCK